MKDLILTENLRYIENRHVFNEEHQEDEIVSSYSKRAAETENGNLRIRDIYNYLIRQDHFGLPTVYFKDFEITLENTTLGMQVFIRKDNHFWGRMSQLRNITLDELFDGYI